MENKSAKRLYFWIIIVIVGSSGIWLPFCEIDGFQMESVVLSILSYAVVVFVTSATDWGIKAIAQKQVTTLLKCMGVPLLCCLVVYAITKLLSNNQVVISIAISTIGMIASLIFWWKVDDLDKYEPNSSLGGNVS